MSEEVGKSRRREDNDKKKKEKRMIECSLTIKRAAVKVCRLSCEAGSKLLGMPLWKSWLSGERRRAALLIGRSGLYSVGNTIGKLGTGLNTRYRVVPNWRHQQREDAWKSRRVRQIWDQNHKTRHVEYISCFQDFLTTARAQRK